ncbi:MAG: VanW family protein [Clostridia bacterium]|nr:VanW family protein [Clostridia bacterium]
MQKFFTKKSIIISVCALLGALMLMISGLSYYDAYHSAKVTSGVTLNSVMVGGKTEEEISQLLDVEIGKPKVVQVAVSDQEITLDLNSAGFSIDKDKTMENLRRAGKDNFFQALKARLFKTPVTATVVSDPEMFATVIDTLLTEKDLNAKKFDYTIENNVATIVIKTDVTSYDTNQLYTEILTTYPEISERYTMKQAPSAPPTVEEVKAEINVPVMDAKLEKVDGKNRVIPHQVGLSLDEDVLLSKLSAEETEFQVPLTVLKPKVYTDDLAEDAFPNRLATYTTRYNEGEVSRSANVKLAAKKVNGTVLNPGDIFSFNKVVGKRSYENGFKDAKIFLSDKVVDGTGGGICQVSSTIYPAVLYSDLKIVERRNHNFVVSYAKNGIDATVVYGSIDFKFQNSLQNPIRIKASAVNGNMTVEVWGTKENNNTVELTTKQLGSTARGVKYEYNEALEPGEEKVTQAGYDGVKVQAYRIVKDAAGTVIRTDNLGVSNYVPLTKIIETSDKGLVETGVPTVLNPEETPVPSDNPAVTPEPTSPVEIVSPSATPSATPAPEATPESTIAPTPVVTPENTTEPVATIAPENPSNEPDSTL